MELYDEFDVMEFDDQDSGPVGTNVASRTRSHRRQCCICYERYPYPSFMSTRGCAHEYCKKCCETSAASAIQSGRSQIRCLSYSAHHCKHTFSKEQLEQLLSKAELDILKKRQLESSVPWAERIYCPFPECSALQSKLKRSSNLKRVRCRACRRDFCLKCNVPWHAGRTCAGMRKELQKAKQVEEKGLRDLAERMNWKTCPECRRLVERVAGCERMICLCGHSFCYCCGMNWYTKLHNYGYD